MSCLWGFVAKPGKLNIWSQEHYVSPKGVEVENKMTREQYSLVLVLTTMVVFFALIPCINAFADGFGDKRVKFDGKATKGKLDNENNLGFTGQAKWNAPVTVKFSPIVRSQFSLVPFIETEAGGILGAYTITFTFVSKTRSVTYQNLSFKILDREGNEIASTGMVSGSGPGWVIGVATEQEPFDMHITYSPEKRFELTPADFEKGSDL